MYRCFPIFSGSSPQQDEFGAVFHQGQQLGNPNGVTTTFRFAVLLQSLVYFNYYKNIRLHPESNS
jgi:hypothetical protein